MQESLGSPAAQARVEVAASTAVFYDDPLLNGGDTLKFAKQLVAFAALTLSIGNVMAVPPGKTLEFASPMGKVIFDGKAHADQGLKCADCHSKPKLFGMKKGSDKINMAAMNEGKFCGACHDVSKAFSVKAPADCVKCHKKGNTEAKAKAEAAGAGKPAKEEAS